MNTKIEYHGSYRIVPVIKDGISKFKIQMENVESPDDYNDVPYNGTDETMTFYTAYAARIMIYEKL